MLRHTFANLLLLWLFACDLSTESHYDMKKQSLHNQSLYSIPLDLNSDVKILDLSDNFIRQLHSLGLPYLQQLDISNNQLLLISEEVFENLAQLEELNLSRNALYNNLGRNSKALQSIRGLRCLDISLNGLNNEAVELFLQNMSFLSQVTITGNYLTKLTPNLFKGSPNLRDISIDNNLIADIEQGTFEPLDQLETLNLAKNNLANVCDFKLNQIRHLNLSHNSIEFFVTHDTDKMYRLYILDISYNKLLYFPILPKTSCLKYLYLQNNMIGATNSEATLMTESKSLFKDIIGEDNNTVENYFNKRLMPITFIDLSNNHFSFFQMKTLSIFTSLETLFFSFNCLKKIRMDISNDNHQTFFPSLRYFDLKNNQLEYISPIFLSHTVPKLETLNLRENFVKPCTPADIMGKSQTINTESNITCIAFDQIRTLKHLNLEGNYIRMLHPHTFMKTSLMSLNLARNPDMVLHVGALDGVQTTLESLTLSEIKMTNLDLSFPCLMALRHLNISNNCLNTLPSSLSCTPLRELDISNNVFVSLNHSLITDKSAHLEKIYIRGNSLNCCDTTLVVILNELRMKVADISQAECISSVNNIVLTDYLKDPSMYCLFNNTIPEITLGQVIIICLFVTTVLTSAFILARKWRCQGSSIAEVNRGSVTPRGSSEVLQGVLQII